MRIAAHGEPFLLRYERPGQELHHGSSQWVQSVSRNAQVAVLTSALASIEGLCTFARRYREGLISEADLTQTCVIFKHDFLRRYGVLVVDPLGTRIGHEWERHSRIREASWPAALQ